MRKVSVKDRLNLINQHLLLFVQKAHAYLPPGRAIWQYVLAGLVSGIPYAYLIASKSDSEGQAIGTFASQWFPGLIFGFLFAGTQRWPSHTTLSFAAISAVIYYFAVQITLGYVSNFSGTSFGYSTPSIKDYVIAGALSGGFGAAMLSWMSKLFSDTKRTIKQESLTMLLGAGMGPIFVLLFLQQFNYGAPVEPTSLDKINFFLKKAFTAGVAYASWQGSIGARIGGDLLHSERSVIDGEFSEKLSAFLQGPVVQLLGLIGSLLGILSLITNGD